MRFATLFCFVLISFYPLKASYLAKGADISWVPGQESRGTVFYDTNGVQRDIFDILNNDYQMNTIRLRVFVNPSGDWGNGLCDIDATVGMALRTRAQGMRLMLTLHYSDSWADPGKQFKPAAWENYSVAQLETAVYNHTRDVMLALDEVGITPEWVQIGNETNDGMLWPEGRASSNMANYARFVNAGHNAVKEISSETKTIVHLSNGFDNGLYRWNIGGLVNNNAQFDIIAMSAYPEYAPDMGVNDWARFNDMMNSNMVDMVSHFNKPVMISEIGMDYRAEDNCRAMIADVIVKLRALENNMGLGVLYWEPQAGPGYNRGYDKGAWRANGRPTRALNGFIEDMIIDDDECTPTAVTSFIQVDGGEWDEVSDVTIQSGTSVMLGPQPVIGGQWHWEGCGSSGTEREQLVTPAASCTATATYTNTCGAQSTQDFTITVEPVTGICMQKKESFHSFSARIEPLSDGRIRVSLPQSSSPAETGIFCINGRKVYRGQVPANEKLILGTDLKQGVYFITIRTPDYQFTRQFTLVR